jgi:hypothetical protein
MMMMLLLVFGGGRWRCAHVFISVHISSFPKQELGGKALNESLGEKTPNFLTLGGKAPIII